MEKDCIFRSCFTALCNYCDVCRIGRCFGVVVNDTGEFLVLILMFFLFFFGFLFVVCVCLLIRWWSMFLTKNVPFSFLCKVTRASHVNKMWESLMWLVEYFAAPIVCKNASLTFIM